MALETGGFNLIELMSAHMQVAPNKLNRFLESVP